MRLNIKKVTKKYHGYSLIELLITQCLSMLIINGMIIFYLTLVKLEIRRYEIQKVHDKVKVIMQYMSDDVQNLGFYGCDPVNAIRQIEISYCGQHPVLILKYVGRYLGKLKKTQHINSEITILSSVIFHPVTKIFVTDCSKASLYSIIGKNLQLGVNLLKINNEYHDQIYFKEGSSIFSHEQIVYFLAKSSHPPKKDEHFSLFRKVNESQPMALIEGIETFDVQKKGTGILLNIVVRTERKIGYFNQTIKYPNHNKNYNDGYYRKHMTLFVHPKKVTVVNNVLL